MPIVFKDSKPSRQNTTKNGIVLKNTKEMASEEYYRHSHAGFIVVIILLVLLSIGSPIAAFFWAKGIGWNEAIEKTSQEYYSQGYEKGKSDGENSGWNVGRSLGIDEGYKEGFEDARECASQIISGYLRDSIYTCYKR